MADDRFNGGPREKEAPSTGKGLMHGVGKFHGNEPCRHTVGASPEELEELQRRAREMKTKDDEL